jgi:integrase
MATFKYIVSPYCKDDGTHNVMIYVFHNGKKRYPPTGYYLSKNDLTKSLKIKNHNYMDSLEDIVRRCRNRCNNNIERLGNMNVEQVVELIRDIIEGRENSNQVFDLDFIKYGHDYVEKLKKDGHEGNSKTYEIALNNLVKYIGRNTLSVHEITFRFIQNWIDWIKSTSKGGRAESLYPSNIRALHNRAKNEFNDEEIGLICIPLSPFKKIKLPNLPETKHRALTTEQIRQIFSLPDKEQHQTKTNRYNFARDMFLLSFMLVGMNEADLYNCSDISNNRITYQRTKVKNRRKDKGKISIKIEHEATALIEKYRDESGTRIFRFYKMYANIGTFTAAINGFHRKGAKGDFSLVGLKKIGEDIGIDDLEFYAARHSWASIALNEVGIDKYTVHTALNHVVDEMKITDIYIKKDWSIIDRANRKVLDYILST